MKNATLFLTSCFWMMTVAHAQQVTDGPSIEDTITYINSHCTHRNNTCLVSVSLHENLLTIQNTFSEGIKRTTIPFRFISQVKAKVEERPDGTGEVWLQCPQTHQCMHWRIDRSPVNKPAEKSDAEGTEAADSDDTAQANRVQHAFTHLFTLLDQRYQQQVKQRDPNDPFK